MKKDKNGIEKKCSNCRYYEVCASNEVCEKYTITIKAYEACITELQSENKRLLDCLTEHNILHPDAQRGMDRLNALADKREGLKPKCEVLKEQAFTIEEINFVKIAISMEIIDCENNHPKPSDEKLKLMWSIKSKCDAFLKGAENELELSRQNILSRIGQE